MTPQRLRRLLETRRAQGLCACGRGRDLAPLVTCSVCAQRKQRDTQRRRRERLDWGLCLRCGALTPGSARRCGPCRLEDTTTYTTLRQARICIACGRNEAMVWARCAVCHRRALDQQRRRRARRRAKEDLYAVLDLYPARRAAGRPGAPGHPILAVDR